MPLLPPSRSCGPPSATFKTVSRYECVCYDVLVCQCASLTGGQGWAGGGSLPFASKNNKVGGLILHRSVLHAPVRLTYTCVLCVLSQDFLRSFFHRWDAAAMGRQRAMPHIKVRIRAYCRVSCVVVVQPYPRLTHVDG